MSWGEKSQLLRRGMGRNTGMGGENGSQVDSGPNSMGSFPRAALPTNIFLTGKFAPVEEKKGGEKIRNTMWEKNALIPEEMRRMHIRAAEAWKPSILREGGGSRVGETREKGGAIKRTEKFVGNQTLSNCILRGKKRRKTAR